jgi:hypothetical protein
VFDALAEVFTSDSVVVETGEVDVVMELDVFLEAFKSPSDCVVFGVVAPLLALVLVLVVVENVVLSEAFKSPSVVLCVVALLPVLVLVLMKLIVV